MSAQDLAAGVAGWTPEQLQAIERRDGELFLDAGAGSGKTAVLVERFVRAVVEDGIEVSAILTITFTDKAAGEMRERIRDRLRAVGAFDAARDAEGAFISTIHGFCARVLRTHALASGLDPAFVVLDELQAGQLADGAFEEAVEELARRREGSRLVAAYGLADLRGAVRSLYAELRSRGQLRPGLPVLAAVPDGAAALERVERAAATLLAELSTVAEPAPRVVQAIERLGRFRRERLDPHGWPGELGSLRLPAGNGAALSTPACAEYSDALDAFRASRAAHWARLTLPEIGSLLELFGERYERRKRERSGLDFQDLELLCVDRLRADAGLRAHYRERFDRVMVDELQDTNAVQLELIEAVSRVNLFTVGDAQQAIYGFRHASVELFECRGERLEASGARMTVETNFRSRPEILGVINRVFGEALRDAYRPLRAGRGEQDRGQEPCVELLVADREAEWAQAPDGLGAPWRLAEARILARRVGELTASGAAPSDIVVLTRATTDLRAYERALEAEGIPTYLVGGRGYWLHPQVVDMVAYLRVLANPRDEEALYTVMASPLLGVSYDALVLLGAAARESDRDPWWVLREPKDRLAALENGEAQRLVEFAAWLAQERVTAVREGADELIERALERTGYDLAILRMPGGQRRLANIRKLMRLAREHAVADGPDLRGFLALVRDRARGVGFGGGARESEAPIESEALEAVRLMTIHRAKGLEFAIVCVADLGRAPWKPVDVVRIGDGGRIGLRLARPGTGPREPALAYEELGDERKESEAREERRLFYVAATRARERLIFSGAAKLDDTWGRANGGAPISWLGPALVPELPALLERGETAYDGVRFDVVLPEDEPVGGGGGGGGSGRRTEPPPAIPSPSPSPPPPTPAGVPRALSYSAIAEYHRCGYRYYVERVLGLPEIEWPGRGGLAPADRGAIVHELLERLDFRRPVVPAPEAIAAARADAEEIAVLLQRFAASELCSRLGRARSLRREQPFGFLLGQTMINGVLDVVASEAPGTALVVDYKTDRLDGAEPAGAAASRYGAQRLIYALAALRSGANRVEVLHVFMERPAAPVAAVFTAADAVTLERELEQLIAGLGQPEYPVSEIPRRGLCHGCPAEGGLCSWPLQMTRREQPDRLF